jgi:anti-sigma regulatory factor (Ser/Thr protein kinase)
VTSIPARAGGELSARRLGDISQIELAALPAAAGLTRQFIHAVLSKWQLADELADTAALIGSELVTNAIRATGGTLPDQRATVVSEIGVTLRLAEDGLVIEVRDSDPSPPVLGRPGVLDESGRGLILVSKLAATWGFRPYGPGKAVWALVSCRASGLDHPPAAPG